MFDNIESIELPPDQEIRAIIKKLLKDPTIFHPRSLIFRPMKIDKLKTLAVDIKLNGLKHKITKTKDIKDGKIKIIDGKNRYIACKIVNVPTRYKYKNDLTEIEKIFFVVRENLTRKHYKRNEEIIIGVYVVIEVEKLWEIRELTLVNQHENQEQLNKIKVIQNKLLLTEVAELVETKPKTIRQAKEILEISNTNPKFKKQWEQVEKGKPIEPIYNKVKGDIKKPIKPITQIEISKKLRETQDGLTKRCLFLEKKCETLESNHKIRDTKLQDKKQDFKSN